MMESRMTRNCHVRFGEKDEETHKSRDLEVRFVPTPFSPLLSNIALQELEDILESYVKKHCMNIQLNPASGKDKLTDNT
jgi:hypothetical protein